ncbi:surfeit locus protein 1-like [Physella acuta]|uniref:surfeit locus protein 1-like n=1 Tax=Physella acuta TaxID=109671 RepID=UPI0027DCC06C|nr:surfeit locus protein 1-like [Physella acuta]
MSFLAKIHVIFISRLNSKLQILKVGIRLNSQIKGPRQIPRLKPAVKQSTGGGIPLLIIPLTAFGLGTWQIFRREWKLGLIKELEEKMSAPPIPLPQNLENLEDMEYTKVTIRGRFDHSRELFIGPRSDYHSVETMGGQERAAKIGVHVVTPFKLSDRDETILVNRGHVTFKKRPPQLRMEGQIEDEVEITGVIRKNDKKSILDSDPLKDGFWLSRNIDEMAEIAGTAKVFIDADFNSTVPGGPTGGQTTVEVRNEHMSYIITWYALSILTFYMWMRAYRRPRIHSSVLDMIRKEHSKF